MDTEALSGPSVKAKAYAFEIGKYRYDLDTKLLVLTLEGIVNRDAPRLFVDGEGLCDWAPADKKWMSVYSERKGIRFEKVETLEGLINAFRSHINGLVVYDPELDATRYIAVTIAALNNYLPVSPNQITGVIASLRVREDLRGRWKDSESAYTWAIKELLPKCSKTIAFNAGQSHDNVQMGTDLAVILALDYAVAKKAFVFNLSPAMEDGTYGWDKIPIPGFPEDAKMMDTILSKYKSPCQVWGWAEPEWTFTSRLSKHGHFLMCGTAGNLSFHAIVPAEQKTWKQPKCKFLAESDLENKYYIAFMTNEGDTARVLTSFFFGGWLNPDRGKIVVNWGVNPTLLHDFPVFAEYYFSSATKNDYFYAGCSGTGYAFIDQLPNVADFARHGKPFFDQFDIHVVDAWDEHKYVPKNYDTYAKEAGVQLFISLPRGGARIEMLPSGVPVVVQDERLHYKTGNAEKNVPDIKALSKEITAPFVIPCYGGLNENTPRNYMKIMEQLPAQTFQAVSLADVAVLARKIGQKSK